MEGLDLEERYEIEDLKLAYLPYWPTCFSDRLGLRVPRKWLPELGAGETEGGVRKVEGENMSDLLKMRAERLGRQLQKTALLQSLR